MVEKAVEAQFDQDTVWLSLDQMSDLFQRDKSTISRTIKRGERRLQRCLRYGAEAYLRNMDNL